MTCPFCPNPDLDARVVFRDTWSCSCRTSGNRAP
jgi:hypothetical protein